MFAGLSFAAVAATFRFAKKSNEDKTPNSMSPRAKFLTQDGKLVEIDADNVPNAKLAATKKDIQHWINKNKSL